MNFLNLVKKILLLEDPDQAVYNNIDLKWSNSSARTFFVGLVHFLNPESKELALFYSLKEGSTHEDLYTAVAPENVLNSGERLNSEGEWIPSWNSYPSSMKKRMKQSKKENRGEEPYEVKSTPFNMTDLVSGRYWMEDKKFLISFWKGKDKDIKKWINPVLPLWNPHNLPILYQAPGSENWEDGNKFLASSSSPSLKETPEIKKLRREINQLLPQVHISSGIDKQKIKSQIQSLQNQIKSLGGKSSLSSGESLKGSYKTAQIAGKMSVAQMKALSQTSESKLLYQV